jgi:hypothetical protein
MKDFYVFNLRMIAALNGAATIRYLKVVSWELITYSYNARSQIFVTNLF